MTAEVVVVGSGLTAAYAAALLARDGRAVVLMAGGAVGDEAACGVGEVGVAPAAACTTARAALGARATRAIWAATRRAGLDLTAALGRWGAPCALSRVPRFILANDDGQAAALERERAALDVCGVDTTWLGPSRTRAAVGVDGMVALRFAEDGTVDPVRATLAAARAAVALGATCIEHAPVDGIARSGDGVVVSSGRHEVSAVEVIVAGAALGRGFRALHRHVSRASIVTCVLPPLAAAERRAFGRPALVELPGADGLTWRLTDDGRAVVSRIVGADDRASAGDALSASGALMYDLSRHQSSISGQQPAHRWLSPTTTGSDGLPIAGRHRAFPRHVFALARADRLAECALAARVAVAAVRADVHPAADWLGFSRVRAKS